MYSQRSFLLALLLFAPCAATASASDLELKLGQPHESALSPGQAQSFVISLGEGDFALLALNPRGQILVVKTCDPSGKPFRGAELGPGQDKLALVAQVPGTYRVEVAEKDPRASATFSISLERLVPLAERLAPPKPVVESPRIQALRTSLQRGEQNSLNAFWQEIQQTGAPLIEPIPGDRENMAVTFLWKHTPDTHNVIVLWIPYVAVAPDEFFMERLGQTDVWYKTIKVNRKMRLAYTLAPNAGRIHPFLLGFDPDVIGMTATAARPDPLNLKRYRIDPGSPDAPEFRGNSILEMPDAPPQPWIAPRPNVPTGKVEKHPFKSVALNNEREIAIYLPPGYSPHANPYPLLVLFDENAYLTLVPTPTILDNLISEARIPPTVAILVGNAPGDARDRELACNPEFNRALATELLPWAHQHYTFTSDPHLTVIAGSSRGGFASACAALAYPEIFGNVLAQSGSFHIIPSSSSDPADSNSEPNWMARQFIASPKKPLRFYLDAGSAEFNATGGPDAILFCTLTLRDVLRAKGYQVYFQKFEGGHDYLSWRGTLADGLIALLGDTASKTLSERDSRKQ